MNLFLMHNFPLQRPFKAVRIHWKAQLQQTYLKTMTIG